MKIFDPTKAITKAVPQGQKRRAAVVAGPPGTGKSTFLGSAAEVVGGDRVLLLATLSRELESWKYEQYNPDRILFEDPDWIPEVLGENSNVLMKGKYSASGFANFLKTLEHLRTTDDQYDVILVDSGTELAELAWHAALAPYGVSSPSGIDGRSRWLPYETLDTNLGSAIDSLISLTHTAKRPKHVLITWHTQPPKDDQEIGAGSDKTTKKSADNVGEGVEYEGKVLPMVRGRFRRRLANKVPTFIYTDVQTQYATGGVSMKNRGTEVKYRLQVRPDLERHTKVPGPLPEMQYIPNDFKSFLALLDASEAAPAPVPNGRLSKKP